MRKLFRLFKRSSAKEIDSQCFNTLDELPIFNWWQLNSGKLEYLFKKLRQPSKKEKTQLIKLFKKISSDYIDRYGITREFKFILNKQREIALYKLKYVKTEDAMLLTMIQIAEEQLKERTGDGEKGDFYETKSAIETQLGFRIDPKTTTVAEYQGYIKQIQKKWQKS